MFENPGPHDVEFVRIDGEDSEDVEVEAYVVHAPIDEMASFGVQGLSWIGVDNDNQAEAWSNRQSPPGVVPPGTMGNVVVVVPAPSEGDDVRYVDEFEIEVRVDGRSETYDWQAFRIIGDDEACDLIPLGTG